MNNINPITQPKTALNNKNTQNNKNKVAIGSFVGTAIGIAGSLAGVYALAKKGNPSISLKNFSFTEKDILMLGAGSVAGGLAGGLIADHNKDNVKPKLREASQQFFGNIAAPLGFLTAGNKLLEKSGFKLPQIKSESKPAKIANAVLNIIPKTVVTVVSLISGMEIGNKVMNKVNNKIFKEDVKHDVKIEDYLVHADDLCLTANMLLKNAKPISAVTSKVLPLTFLLSGSKTGMQGSENTKEV